MQLKLIEVFQQQKPGADVMILKIFSPKNWQRYWRSLL
jgi:hypothetical protein